MAGWIDEVVPPDVRLFWSLVFAYWFLRQFEGFCWSYKLPRALKIGGQPFKAFRGQIFVYGAKCCAESDFEVRFAKFGHIPLPKMEVVRFRVKKGFGKSGSRECVKIKIKGVDKKHWPQFSHIDADSKNSRRDLELALYVFTYLSRAHRFLITFRFPESWDWELSNGANIVKIRCDLAG